MNSIPPHLQNPDVATIRRAISTWHPFFALPTEAVEFMRHFSRCQEDKEPIDPRFWISALNAFLQYEQFHISLQTGKVLHTYFPDVPEDMMRCDGCGDVWDGCRQCDCPGVWEMYQLYPDEED